MSVLLSSFFGTPCITSLRIGVRTVDTSFWVVRLYKKFGAENSCLHRDVYHSELAVHATFPCTGVSRKGEIRPLFGQGDSLHYLRIVAHRPEHLVLVRQAHSAGPHIVVPVCLVHIFNMLIIYCIETAPPSYSKEQHEVLIESKTVSKAKAYVMKETAIKDSHSNHNENVITYSWIWLTLYVM